MKQLRILGMVSLGVLAACSSAGTEGEAGTPGAPGEPGAASTATTATTVNQIAPRVGLLGRDLSIRITFDGPALPAGATVELGDGVTVTKVAVDGNALVCDLTVDEGTTIGARDVTIKAPGMSSVVAQKGFVVAAAMDLKVSGGKPEQGGLVRVDLLNEDKVWFDTENFVLVPVASATDATLVQLTTQAFTGTDGSVILLGDPLAKTGALGFLGLNDPSDSATPTFLTKPDAVTVAARTPEALTPGTPFTKTLAKELETAFLSATLTPTGTEGLIVDAKASAPAGSTMSPMILGYPASGKIGDLLDQKQDDPGFPDFGIPATEARIIYPVVAATKGFFIVVDSGLKNSDSTKLAVDLTTVRAQIVKEQAGAHDATPQNLGSLPGTAVTIPGRIVTGELKTATEADVYTFTGLSAANPTDMQISLTSNADVTVLVDTVATFDSDGLVTVALGGKAGSASTAGFVGTTRFIKVVAADGASTPTGTYTLGFRRIVVGP